MCTLNLNQGSICMGRTLPDFYDLVSLPGMEINSMIQTFKCHLTNSLIKVKVREREKMESKYLVEQEKGERSYGGSES